MTEFDDADARSLDEVDNLTQDELAAVNEADHKVLPVTYSGTDFDVEGLVRRLNRADIAIPSFGHGDPTLEAAGFQRGFVWRRPQMDRFIESLLLGFPIPGIILVQQQDKRYLVLDGQQRLRTLAAFYSGVHAGIEFALQNVADEYKGLTYKTLPAPLRRQLDNTFIQATIVKTDGTGESLEAVYQVFERLNSGGTQLTPHEIRIALYPGEMVDFISGLNKLPEWRNLYGKVSPRVRDQELILRIIALFMSADEYERPLKTFLNDFLGKHRHLEDVDVEQIQTLFEQAAALLNSAAGRSAIRYQSNQVNAALAEALFVGLMKRIQAGSNLSPRAVRSIVDSLSNNKRMTAAISGSTASEENIKTRLNLASSAFRRTR
ncbi:DUF262 domain-containing protein [Actinokineospora spheciospongiae]|uniref:DUF262 domain-containing protein n=1 Tax=Actinokineospora spheciospongiae TaxID=909613 RepID=UPI0004B61E41|nr:DUF262 domain-containing protein [Actinokineospora spheciospongiae]